MIHKIKNLIKRFLASVVYLMHRVRILPNKIKVYSVDETLDILLTTEKSMVRFGDGEIVVLSGKNIFFQTASPEISEGLKRILQYKYDDLIVTLPDIFDNLDIYVPASQRFWKDHLLFFRKVYNQFCNPYRKYYNTSVSRGYVTLSDKSYSGKWFNKFRQLFKDKKLVIVEGSTTHNGVGNDLFEYAYSIERIICPSRNAYCVRDKIREKCLEYAKDVLFLFSLGITAKGLVEELFLEGYRVLDIGNLDMEYEWFLRNALKKEEIPKHNIVGVEANKAAGYNSYLEQIVYTISECKRK